MKDRNHSIDIAKGLLILFVVWFHMKTILGGSCGFYHETIDFLYRFHKLYAIFFLPAFFLITGYCSNFYKSFIPFLSANTKGLLLPMIILNLIPCIISHNRQAFIDVFGNSQSWLSGLSFWFIPVMFLTKIFSWFVVHIGPKPFRPVIAILLFILAIFFTKLESIPNIWFWKTSLAYVFFVIVGLFLKESSCKPLMLKYSIWVYLPMLAFVLFNDLPVWYLGVSVICNYSDIPFFLVTAISGSFMIIYLAGLVRRNIVLEKIGEASLVVYCSHWYVAQILGKYSLLLFTPKNNMTTITMYVVILIITILVSYIVYCLLNYIKPIVSR